METVVFVFSLLDCCALIFLSVYFIITLSDLECDYINARSCCSKLNKWVIPEVVGHTIITVLMLISLHWFIFLLNLPVATWNIYRLIMVPSGNMGVFDPTEIHNRGQLKSHMKEAMIKLGFHLLCFFMYLYSPGLDLPVAEAREPLSKTPYTTDPHFEDGGTLVTCERDSEMAK
ncbi:Protein cornichon-like protein 4 [Camelus dromedarius]|uniref:Protein cornichon-like protein 4 n=1 Tax=Camelus dromedarius TaxID=9838 RepID=A0A5N4CI94_CAMDR|nr:Protein cornichon-like protein 4 [Camelus dromedarius]